MRKECAQLLLEEMSVNDRIRVVTADLGFGILDHIRNAYPDRFYNVCCRTTDDWCGCGHGREWINPCMLFNE
jgi:transketolase C-terminal domain/subunit